MARILLLVLAIGVIVYALIDWLLRSRRRTPGGINRWVWLAVIILIPVAGALAWIILTQVALAEEKRYGSPSEDRAPDDDAEYLREVAERIQRRKKKSGGRRGQDTPPDNADTSENDDEDEENSDQE